MGEHTVVKKAAALWKIHGFDWDIAYLSAWYGDGNTEPPSHPIRAAIAWMRLVKNMPDISDEEAQRCLDAYSRSKGRDLR